MIALFLRASLSLLACVMQLPSKAQCFPDSSASWCFLSLENSTSVVTHMVMEAQPDTVILSQTYKRVKEYNDDTEFAQWQFIRHHYVRSDASGKGYLMLLDSLQEYMVADVNALAGDTVHNVLTAGTWGADQEYWLGSVAVDSVVVRENNAVQVSRQYVHIVDFSPIASSIGYLIFWQAGIGGSCGPLLLQSSSNGNIEPRCLRVQDAYVFSVEFGYIGLPGTPCDCPLTSPLGIEHRPAQGLMVAAPNPSNGLFVFSDGHKHSFTVFTLPGKAILSGNSSVIDLLGHPAGIYTAIVTTPFGVCPLRLVVL